MHLPRTTGRRPRSGRRWRSRPQARGRRVIDRLTDAYRTARKLGARPLAGRAAEEAASPSASRSTFARRLYEEVCHAARWRKCSGSRPKASRTGRSRRGSSSASAPSTCTSATCSLKLDCRSQSPGHAARAHPPAPRSRPGDTASTAAKYGLLTVARRRRRGSWLCRRPGGHVSNGKTIPLPGSRRRLGGRGGTSPGTCRGGGGEQHAVAALPAGLGGNAQREPVLRPLPREVAVTIRILAIAAGGTVVTSFSVVPRAPREQRAIPSSSHIGKTVPDEDRHHIREASHDHNRDPSRQRRQRRSAARRPRRPGRHPGDRPVPMALHGVLGQRHAQPLGRRDVLRLRRGAAAPHERSATTSTTRCSSPRRTTASRRWSMSWSPSAAA